MIRRLVPVLCALTLIVGVHADGRPLQDSGEVLRLAAEAIGTRSLGSLRYSGSGSSYTFGLDPDAQETRTYSKVTAYVHEVDPSGLTSRLEVTRTAGEPRVEDIETRAIDADTPWESQIDLWLNPHVFLGQALSGDAQIEAETEHGVDYTAVTFQAPGGQLLSGYIDDQNVLRKVRTEIDDPALGARTIEGSFLYYEDFDGIRFPTLMIYKQDGSPTLILAVKEVDADPAAD